MTAIATTRVPIATELKIQQNLALIGLYRLYIDLTDNLVTLSYWIIISVAKPWDLKLLVALRGPLGPDSWRYVDMVYWCGQTSFDVMCVGHLRYAGQPIEIGANSTMDCHLGLTYPLWHFKISLECRRSTILFVLGHLCPNFECVLGWIAKFCQFFDNFMP